MQFVTQSFFASNRSRLHEKTADGYVFLASHARLQKSRDEAFPFQQNPDFYYLTGLAEEAHAVLVIEPNGSIVLFVQPRDEHFAQWDGQATLDTIKKQSGISDIRETTELDNYISKLARSENVYCNYALEQYAQRYDMYRNPANRLLQDRLRERFETVRDLRKLLTSLRMVKQPAELQAIQHACQITIDSLKSVDKQLKKLATEKEVELAISREQHARGGTGFSFTPIVASGVNACTIHYKDNSDTLADKDFVLCDVGTTVDGYGSDISRTLSINEPSSRFSEIYAAVEEVKCEAEKLLQPGVLLAEYEKEVAFKLRDALVGLGLLAKNADVTELKKYYPHATSHHLGLDTHDVVDWTTPLTENMVLTIEPGIYVPKEQIGIRLEDVYVITESGAKDITKMELGNE